MTDKNSTRIETGSMQPEHYARKSNREIRELAAGIHAGSIFGSWMIRPADMIPNVFMCLRFMDDIQTKMMQRDDIVHVYGYIKDAAPRSINGMPIFYSMYMLNIEDVNRVKEALKQLEAFMGGDDED